MKAQEAFEYLGTMAAGIISPPDRRGSVVMFHDGRSGSTVVGDLLNQQPEMFWDSEIFLPNRLNPLPAGAAHFLMRHPDRLIQARRMRTDKPFYGLEVKFTQLERIGMEVQDFLGAIAPLDFNYFMILERKNGLRRIVSDAVGRSKETKSYHISAREDARLIRVRLDVKNLAIGPITQPLIEHLRAYERQIELAKNCLKGSNLLYLTYEEDIMADPLVAYGRICRFLDLQPQAVKVHYNKTNPFPLSEIILNFAEVEAELAGSEFAWMLND